MSLYDLLSRSGLLETVSSIHIEIRKTKSRYSHFSINYLKELVKKERKKQTKKERKKERKKETVSHVNKFIKGKIQITLKFWKVVLKTNIRGILL